MDVNNSIGLEKCQSPSAKPGFTLTDLFTFISFERHLNLGQASS